MHVDEFVDSHKTDEYASWFLFIHRLPAVMRYKFREYTKDIKLFCEYKGECYRVTGASRLGDIWLTKNYEQETGYQLRVDIDDCINFSDKPF